MSVDLHYHSFQGVRNIGVEPISIYVRTQQHKHIGKDMISDEEVRQLYLNGKNLLTNYDNSGPQLTQFFRGKLEGNWEGQLPGACMRHVKLFDHFNIIPRYCFSCYKILIEPRTVIDFFKLMMIFEKVKFPNDNTRKCYVEGRPATEGTYKGFIYCRSIDEGENLIQMLKPILTDEISNNISISLKRGCTEFGISYPSYAQMDPGKAPMKYKEERQQYEDLADKHSVARDGKGTYNRPTYVLEDYITMLNWLKYAATIGDGSYLKISDVTLQPFKGLIRPTPFQSIDANE